MTGGVEEENKKQNLQNPVQGGGKTDKYTWTQDISSLLVTIDLPSHIKGKDISVQFEKKKLKVSYKDSPEKNVMVLDGETKGELHLPECTWQIENDNGRKQLLIHLHKVSGYWWSCVVVGDPEVDTDKIDAPQANISDLNPEMRTTVEKMMLEHWAKTNPNPKAEEMIKKRNIAKLQSMYPNIDFSNCDFSNCKFDFQNNGDFNM